MKKKYMVEAKGAFAAFRKPRAKDAVAVLAYKWSKAPWNKREIPRFIFQIKGQEPRFVTIEEATNLLADCGLSLKERVKILSGMIRTVEGRVSDFALSKIVGVNLEKVQEPLPISAGGFELSSSTHEVVFEKETNTLYSLDLLEV